MEKGKFKLFDESRTSTDTSRTSTDTSRTSIDVFVTSSEVQRDVEASTFSSQPIRQDMNFPAVKVRANFKPSSPKRNGHVLTWSNVNMKVKSTNGKRHVLKNLEGSILPGQLSAIMGHSGSGKTSLLNILAGRIHTRGNVSVTHNVKLDGKTVSLSSIRRKIAFVAQQDVLLQTATPRESIRFSARLRLDRKIPDDKIEILTTGIINELGLSIVADSQISRLSGGEMRRTSLGIELVLRPSIVLLDEVTSGLDRYNAMQVLQVLKKVSVSGASVLFTLHQPNSQMFSAIDHLILLHRGRCMYQGAVENIPTYFAERGFDVPKNYNPADWMLIVSESSGSTEELDRRGFFANFPLDIYNGSLDYGGLDNGCFEHYAIEILGVASKKQGKTVGHNTRQTYDRISMMHEVWLLLKRGWYCLRRDRKLLTLRFFTICGGGALVGITFGNVGVNSIDSIARFHSHLGAAFMLCMNCGIVTQVVLLEFIDERPVVLREYATNHYRMTSYMISRLIIEALTIFLQVLVFTLITYWALGLQGRFWYLLFCFYIFSIVGSSAAIALGSYTTDPRDAKESLPMLMLPQMLFSGFFVSLSRIPIWLRWLQWTMPLTYVFRLVVAEEFEFCNVPGSSDLSPVAACYDFLHTQMATKEFSAKYWWALVGIVIFFRILAILCLRRRMQENQSVA